MRKVLLSFAVLLFLTACGGSESSTNGPADVPLLLRAVPSDALAVMCFDKCADALDASLDSTDVLCRLNYGTLSKRQAVLALCNVGSITPLLALNAGHAASDTSSAAATLLADASANGILAEIVNISNTRAVLLTRSQTVMTLALRHVQTESSILDAPGFDAVCPLIAGNDVFVYRNSGARKLYTYDLLDKYIPRKNLSSFLSSACDWTVLDASSYQKGEYQIHMVDDDSPNPFSVFVAGIQDAQSKAAQALPESYGLAVDIVVAPGFREAYEARMDASMQLEAYRQTVSRLKSASGKSPLAWEKEQGVKEAMTVWTDAGQLNLIRVSSKGGDGNVSVNQYKGFANALYGTVFSAADSCCVRCGDWIVSGSREVLNAYEPSGHKQSNWPAKAKFVVSTPEAMFSVAGEQTELKIY